MPFLTASMTPSHSCRNPPFSAKHLVLSIDQRYWEHEADICRDTQPDQGHSSADALNTIHKPLPAPVTTPIHDHNGNLPITHLLTPHGGLTESERNRRI